MKALTLLVLLGIDRPAFAEPPKPSRKQAPGEAAPPAVQPAPGKCSSMQPGVKICSTLSGHGSFDVYTYPPASLYIKLPEEILHFVPADEVAFQQDWGGTIATIAPKIFELPQR